MRKEKALRTAAIALTLFVGIGALFGGICMLCDPAGEVTGMSGLLPGLRKLPFAEVLFENLIFSGICLLIVNGFFPLSASVLLLCRSRLGALDCLLSGVLLMAWICIQFVIFPLNLLSSAYFVFGAAKAVLGFFLYRIEKKKSLKKD